MEMAIANLLSVEGSGFSAQYTNLTPATQSSAGWTVRVSADISAASNWKQGGMFRYRGRYLGFVHATPSDKSMAECSTHIVLH